MINYLFFIFKKISTNFIDRPIVDDSCRNSELSVRSIKYINAVVVLRFRQTQKLSIKQNEIFHQGFQSTLSNLSVFIEFI